MAVEPPPSHRKLSLLPHTATQCVHAQRPVKAMRPQGVACSHARPLSQGKGSAHLAPPVRPLSSSGQVAPDSDAPHPIGMDLSQKATRCLPLLRELALLSVLPAPLPPAPPPAPPAPPAPLAPPSVLPLAGAAGAVERTAAWAAEGDAAAVGGCAGGTCSKTVGAVGGCACSPKKDAIIARAASAPSGVPGGR